MTQKWRKIRFAKEMLCEFPRREFQNLTSVLALLFTSVTHLPAYGSSFLFFLPQPRYAAAFASCDWHIVMRGMVKMEMLPRRREGDDVDARRCVVVDAEATTDVFSGL